MQRDVVIAKSGQAAGKATLQIVCSGVQQMKSDRAAAKFASLARMVNP